MKYRRISRPLSLFLHGAALSVLILSFLLYYERLPYLLEGSPAGFFAFLTGSTLLPSSDEPLSGEENEEEDGLYLLIPDEGAVPGVEMRPVDPPQAEEAPSGETAGDPEPVRVLTIPSSLEPKNNPSLSFNVEELLRADPEFDRDADSILIVHTHGCESYSLSSSGFLSDDPDARTADPEKNVVAVGDVLEKELTRRGFRVIHDRTLCDEPGFRTAYKTALGVIEDAMKKDPSIAMVLDIHRDSVSSSDGTRCKLLSGDGKSAEIMFVVGSDALLSHPAWRSNLSFALKLEEKAMELFPDFARPITISKNRYNQHATPLSLIVECGTEANTLSEAKAAAVRLAEILDAVLPA
ncbi:MAG: stage II sporulation protein P [Clostridia bacterium]|nr:stage II sporulation protein P [Clostridia bacterium]